MKTITAALGAAVALIVLPLFGAQSLSRPVAMALAMPEQTTGVIAMMPMLGYAAGLVLLVPLIDIFGVRTVVPVTLLAGVFGLVGAAFASTAPFFFVCAFVVGVATSATQMVIPFAAGLVRSDERGRMIGKVMGGLMVGVLLSRPVASLSAHLVGWRGAYIIEAALLSVVLIGFICALPHRIEARRSSLGYAKLVRSLWLVLREEPVLRRRATCQALCMGAFGSFWTAAPLLLTSPPFDFGQVGIGLFAFAGAGGIVVAPLAGWIGDRSSGEAATRIAHILVVAGSALALLVGTSWPKLPALTTPTANLICLTLAAVVLDMGVIGDQTLGRHAVNMLRPEIRGRVNGLYTGLFFVGAAVGSALAGIVWVKWGWDSICGVGICFGISACALDALTSRKLKRSLVEAPSQVCDGM